MLSTEAPAKRRRSPSAAGGKPIRAPVKRRTQAERSELMRQRLLAAAAEILRDKGYANLRTDDVARVAKVSRGALHHHFPTKDDLILALTSYLMQRSLQHGSANASAALTAADPIEAMIRDAYSFFMTPEFSIFIDLVVVSVKNPSLRQHIKQASRESRIGVEAAWIDTLCTLGVPRDEAGRVVWLTFNMVRGFSVRAIWQNDDQLFRSMVDQWKTMVGVYFKTLGVENL